MVKIIKDKEPTLEQMQAFVGGYITLITLPDGSQLVCDEDGILKDKEMNIEASRLAGQAIVGDVMILKDQARMT